MGMQVRVASRQRMGGMDSLLSAKRWRYSDMAGGAHARDPSMTCLTDQQWSTCCTSLPHRLGAPQAAGTLFESALPRTCMLVASVCLSVHSSPAGMQVPCKCTLQAVTCMFTCACEIIIRMPHAIHTCACMTTDGFGTVTSHLAQL